MRKFRLIALMLLAMLAVPALGLSAFVAFYKHRHAPQKHPDLVVSLPADYLPRPARKPYDGVHPSRREWLADAYSYPVAPGTVGPSVPLNAGPVRYPFACMSVESGLGRPLADNQQGVGSATTGGFSKDCLVPTQVRFFFKHRTSGEFLEVPATGAPDMAVAHVNGRDVPYLVRVETGTLNRYLYLIMVLAAPGELPEAPSPAHWNGKAIYQFRGGVGIGGRQGKFALSRMLGRRDEELSRGFAVLYSSANQTSNHYDVALAWDTAMRVKRQFIALYGEPQYTVGIGGSGGAIQQYLISQNYPGLLDAAIALYSYPDMLSQTIYALDCELLEYYFDVQLAGVEKWRERKNRAWIQGLNASNSVREEFASLYAFAGLLQGRWPRRPGATECSVAWRGMTPLVNNPRYVHFASRFSDELVEQVHWTYWENLRHVFGSDSSGYARQTWDNVGVQYGLEALRARHISPDEFLRLNAAIGGWKAPAAQQPERYWIQEGAESGLAELSPWSHHNARWADGSAKPATRTAADLAAVRAAYQSGHVFAGRLNFPVLDLRHYLDDQLDMHHSSASLSARARVMAQMGNADLHVIWMTRKPHMPVREALERIDDWLQSRRANPTSSRPERIADACFDAAGNIIASGQGVWDGAWNGQQEGACLAAYPAHGTSRTVAGAGIAGDIFKCHLQSVDAAIAGGEYGDIRMDQWRSRLQEIFPEGVCDYSRPDAGRPLELLSAPSHQTPRANAALNNPQVPK